LLLGRRMDTASELLLRKATLIEELRKQRFVGLRDELDQLAVELGDAHFPVPARRFLGEPASASSHVGDNVVAEHVENLVKARPGVHRYVHRKHTRTVLRTSFRQEVVEVYILFIQRVYYDDLWNPAFGGVIPDPLGADGKAVLRVNDYDCKVSDAQCREGLTHEIEVARRVHDVELLLHPGSPEKGSLCGNLPLPFAHVIVGDSRAVDYTPHTADGAATG